MYTHGKKWVQVPGSGTGVTPSVLRAVTVTVRPPWGTATCCGPAATTTPSSWYSMPASSGMVTVEVGSSKVGSPTACAACGAAVRVVGPAVAAGLEVWAPGVGVGVGAALATGVIVAVRIRAARTAPPRTIRFFMVGLPDSAPGSGAGSSP